jgi:hypothetical protein
MAKSQKKKLLANIRGRSPGAGVAYADRHCAVGMRALQTSICTISVLSF